MINNSEYKKELKEVLNIDEIIAEGHKKICIYAGVGAGKSSWVKEVLAYKGNILFITSRKATVKQDLSKSSFKKYYNSHLINNQVLLTNAGLHTLIENISINGIDDLNEFINAFDYIVIDEAHSIATDSTFADSSIGVQSFVEYAVKMDKIVIMMTGTPEPIEQYLKENEWHIVDFRSVCRYVHPKAVYFIKNRNVINRISESITSGQIIYFVNHVEDIIATYKQLLELGNLQIENIALMVADSRKSKFYNDLKSKCKNELEHLIKNQYKSNEKELSSDDLKDKMKEVIHHVKENDNIVYDSITSTNYIPESCKVVLSTSTLREGINIFNENMTMICDNHILSNLIQFFGRVRIEGTKVYIVEDSNPHIVKPDEWLYNYAFYEVKTAKKYMDEYKEDAVLDIDIVREKYKLKDHLRDCNKYTYYDYIEGNFKVARIKYREELRLIDSWDWVRRLQYHCDKYGIHCSPLTNKRMHENVFPEMMQNLIDYKIKLFENTARQAVINIINDVCGSDHKQYSKLNTELEKKGLSYKFESKVGTKGEERGKTYWIVVPTE